MVIDTSKLINPREHPTNESVLDILILGLIVSALAYWIQYRWRHRRLYQLAAKLPGPPSVPILGHAHLLMFKGDESMEVIYELMQKLPTSSKFWVLNQLFIGITNPKDAEIVLSKSINKAWLYKFVTPWMGNGLFSAPADIWKRHRKLIMPTFNQQILNTFVETFVKQSEILNEKLKAKVGQDSFDIGSLLNHCTLDIVCETAMGISANFQDEENEEYIKCCEREVKIIVERCLNAHLYSDLIFKLSGYEAKEKACLKVIHEFTNSVIVEKRKQYYNQKEQTKKMQDFDTKPKRKAFLDYLIELSETGTRLTNQELREEVDTFMFAGSETSATTLGHLLLLIGIHQDVQNKVYEELIDVFGTSGRVATPEDLPQLPYMERVIKETMRMFPITTFLFRELNEEIQLENSTLPAGSTCAIGLMNIHRNAEYWPEPLKFDPDRFLSENVAKRPPNTYMPFSLGIRNCIGLKYGMMAMKIVLSTMLRSYRIHSDLKMEDLKVKLSFINRLTCGFMIKLEDRII